MNSTQRSLTRRMVAGAATATVALGLLGAAAPAVRAADHDQDIWWYNNHQIWQGNDNWHDNNRWRYRSSRNDSIGYRYDGGRPYYYAPPPIYYHTPPAAYAYPTAYAGPAALSVGFTF